MKIATSAKRTGGLSQVELHPNLPRVRVTVKGEEGEPNKVYELNKEDCPAYVQNGIFIVRLNSDGNKMYSMVPVDGLENLKFVGFYHEKDKDPVPATKTGKGNNGPYTYMTFMALFEILDGKNKGMVVPGYFSYNFQAAKLGDKTYAEISHPNSGFTKKLIEFLEVTGLIKVDIPWKENLLPGFQRFIMQRDPKFKGMIKEGRIESLYGDTASKF